MRGKGEGVWDYWGKMKDRDTETEEIPGADSP